MEHKNEIKLCLGDIIEIYASTNLSLHENTYFIDYIDEELLVLIDVATLAITKLNIKDGILSDESITQIAILSRSEYSGYIKQNGFEKNMWLEIRFDDGDVPQNILGQITEIENDMMELTTFPDYIKIYIDFAYKGIPKDLPIVNISERPAPLALRENDTVEQVNEEQITQESSYTVYDENGDEIYKEGNEIPDRTIYDNLDDLYRESDGIEFGEDLDDLPMVIEIPEDQRTYGIEIQLNHLLDELLSTIPNEKRTKKVMENINVSINRYKQLRSIFSKFDDYNDVVGYVYKGELYKPLVEKLNKLSDNISWIKPIVKQKRVLYKENNENTYAGITDDYILKDFTEEFNSYVENRANYYSSSTLNRYDTYYKNFQRIHSPIEPMRGQYEYLLSDHVLNDLETIVDNYNNFNSSVSDYINIKSSQFVVQKYNLGMYKKSSTISASGTSVFYRSHMTPSDIINVNSLIFLPEMGVKMYTSFLRGSTLYTKVNNHSTIFLSSLLKNSDIMPSIIDDLDKEYKYDDNFLQNIQHYMLDIKCYDDEQRYKKFLNAIIPNTRELFKYIQKFLKNNLNVYSIVKQLEPYAVNMDDICYPQLNEMRFYIKNSINQLKKKITERTQDFIKYTQQVKSNEKRMSSIERLFFDNKEYFDLIYDGYKLKENYDSGELLHHFNYCDNGKLFNDAIICLTVNSLRNPEDILSSFEPANIDDMTAQEKMKNKDCIRRVLSKKYGSIKDMQEDNGREDVYFDEEYDDTPYNIMSQYKDEKSKMDANVFRDFLKETLRNKHLYDTYVDDIYLDNLITSLIENKKKVQEGVYAKLELIPKLPPNIDPESLSESDKKQMKIEEETRKKVGYYVRKNNQWVYDSSIDPEMFLENSALFCNISDECNANLKTNVCESKGVTKLRLKDLEKSRMVKEFENRIHLSIEQIKEKCRDVITYDFKQLHGRIRLLKLQNMKQNNYAYAISKLVTTMDILHSPYIHLRDQILDQSDFVKKQSDILKFIEYYCREPMQDVEKVENQFFYYCKETNTKLLPIVAGILAQSFFENKYQEKMIQLCDLFGKESDDGDAIIDVNSSYILRKLDFVSQDEYNEEGQRMISHELMEDDLIVRLKEYSKTMIENKTKVDKEIVYENPQTEVIYNITRAICNNIDIPFENVIDNVLIYTNEQMGKHIDSPEKYEEDSIKFEKKFKKRPIAYEIYKNRQMFMLICCNIIVCIQTAIPSFKKNKTFSNCVKSFNGYPLSGIENNSTIEYLACVLHLSRSDDEPWNSISKMKKEEYVKKMTEKMEMILQDNNINNKYIEKKEYLLLHPYENIPNELNLKNWIHFLPPLMKNNMKTIQSVSRDFEKEYIMNMKEGNKEQFNMLNILKSKISLHGYGIIHIISNIVEHKDLILKTSSNIPFLDNACCHSKLSNPMEYFMKENTTIENYIQIIEHLSELLSETEKHNKASIIYDPKNTRQKQYKLDIINDTLIYEAFIYYCNLNNNLPINSDLEYIFKEKPLDFPKTILEEQIEFLKKNGKKFSETDFHVLMRKIRSKNIFQSYESHYDEKLVMNDILTALNQRDSHIVDGRLRTLLANLYKKYDPKIMIVEERVELTKLKNYLYKANSKMYTAIVKFMDTYSNLDDTKFDKFQDYLLQITQTNLTSKDAVYNVINFIKNSCYYMNKMYPSIIRGQDACNIVHNHWGFSKYHNADLTKIMNNEYGLLTKFQGDVIVNDVLLEVQESVKDLELLMNHLPIHYNIEKDDNVYVSLFDNDAIQLLYIYYWYSCFHEYVSCANNEENLKKNHEMQKKNRRQAIEDSKDDSLNNKGLGDLERIQNSMKNEESLRKRIANILEVFYLMDSKNTYILDSYEEISKKVTKIRYDEKQGIVKAMGEITDNFERKIERQFEQYKMGKYNIGMQRRLVEYDGDMYDAEREGLEIDGVVLDLDEPEASGMDEDDVIEEYDQDYEPEDTF